MKKKHNIIEAYAVKLCPPEMRVEDCAFGLPIFTRDRNTAINEVALMLNHLNIKPEIAVVRFLGWYDIIEGAFIAPRHNERYEANLAEALAEANKEKIHEEK